MFNIKQITMYGMHKSWPSTETKAEFDWLDSKQI